MKSEIESNFVLKFTCETEINKEIPFLDALVTRTKESVYASVYIKPTNTGECLDHNSLCPIRYKTSVISTLLHRAFTVCSSMDQFSQKNE